MGLLWRKKLVLAKNESASGTAEVLAAADAVLAINVELTPLAGETVSRELERSYYGASGELPVGSHQTLAFSTELAAGGAAGTIPPWGRFLKSCGMSETNTATTKTVYKPITGSEPTLTASVNVDGQLHTLAGCLGTWTLSLAANQIPRMRWELTGLYKDPSATAAVANPVYTGWKDPIVASNAGTPRFELHGEEMALSSLELQYGAVVSYREIIGEDSEVVITDRSMTGTATIDMPAVGDFAIVKKAKEGAVGTFELTHGMGAGKIIKFDAPKVQLGPPTFQNADGIWQAQVPLTFRPNAGNDEIVIETN